MIDSTGSVVVPTISSNQEQPDASNGNLCVKNTRYGVK